MTPQKLVTGARLAAKISFVCCLASLVSLSGYGQDLTFDGDSKTQLARFFGPGLRLTYPPGPTSLTTLESRFDHPLRVPVTTVSWSAASMNPSTAVLPPTSASLSTHRKKTTTLRVIAGLLGAGLAGVGAYLVSTSEGSSRVEICTLCSEPPVSQARLQLTGRQGAGIASIAAGAGLLAYAAF
jgi:hypothetical protein